MKNITIITIISLFLVSCGTGWCIKVNGKYGEKSGGFEYCYDPAKSKEIGQTILLNPEKEESVLLDKQALQTIKSEYEQASTKSDKKKLIDQLLEKMK